MDKIIAYNEALWNLWFRSNKGSDGTYTRESKFAKEVRKPQGEKINSKMGW